MLHVHVLWCGSTCSLLAGGRLTQGTRLPETHPRPWTAHECFTAAARGWQASRAMRCR